MSEMSVVSASVERREKVKKTWGLDSSSCAFLLYLLFVRCQEYCVTYT